MTRHFEMHVKFPDGELLKSAVIGSDVILLFSDGRTFSLTIAEFEDLALEVGKHRRMAEIANERAA